MPEGWREEGVKETVEEKETEEGVREGGRSEGEGGHPLCLPRTPPPSQPL